MPVDMRGDAAARVFLHRVYVRVLDCPAVACEGTEDGAADGMGGVALGVRRVKEHVFLCESLGGDDARDVEAALCERAGLVEYDGVRLCQSLQVVAALDEDARAARTADPRKEGERNGNDESTGAGDDEEGECAVDPHGERITRDERRDEGKEHCADDNGGRVPAGKARDERLGGRLLIRRLLHKREDALDGRFLVGGCDLHLEYAGLIDAAADDLVACAYCAGHGFTCERGGVEQPLALSDDPVERHALPRADDDGLADLDLVGEYLLLRTVAQDACRVGTDVHERGDGAAGALNGVALEPLSDLIEQHDGNALGVVAEGNRAEGGDCNEEVLVKDASLADVHRRAPENVPADESVGCEEEYDTDGNVFEDHSPDEECCCSADAHEHSLLLLRHCCRPFLRIKPRALRPARWSWRSS